MIIHKTNYAIQTMSIHPNENWMDDDWILVPTELESKATQYAPFCTLVINKNEELTDIIDDQNARLESGGVRELKLETVSSACQFTIHSGIDVEMDNGTVGHFSLTEEDQINITNAYAAILNGASGYLYHADGELCRLFSAKEISDITLEATKYKIYHTTYCNHLNYWIKRCSSMDELSTIQYGASLPTDLADHMSIVLGMAT